MLVLEAPNFQSKPIEEMSKEEPNVLLKSFSTSSTIKDGTMSVYKKVINEIHLRAAPDRFLRSLPLNKPFSDISDPAFTEAYEAFDGNLVPRTFTLAGAAPPSHGKGPGTRFI